MSDESVTTTAESAPVAETAAPSTETAAAPVETAAPAQAAAPAAPDYGAIQQELGQYRQFFQQYQQSQTENEKRYREMQEVMLRTFAPEEYQRKQQPRYVTEEHLTQMQERMRQEAQSSAMAMHLRTELSSVKEKFSEVFDHYDEDDVLRRWQKTGEPLSKICKSLEEKIAKDFEKRQAKFMSAKQVVAETTKGSPKGGGVPAPTAKNGRGFSGLRQSIRDRLGGS